MSFISKIGGIFSGEVSKTIDSAGNAIDRIVTNDGEKQALKNELSGIIGGAFTTVAGVIRDVSLADANGNWLQRSWRPILMLSFGLTLLFNYCILPMINKPPSDFPGEFWTFLDIIVPTTVLARSYDKFSTGTLRGIDLPFLKKKDRKDEIK